jgi:hypothetical protein
MQRGKTVADLTEDIEEPVETRRIPSGPVRLFAWCRGLHSWSRRWRKLVFFSVINPQELYLLGEPVSFSPVATYSIGFFAFWGVAGASSLLTAWLAEKLPARH